MIEFPSSKNSSKKPNAKSQGRHSWCRPCILKQKKKYYAENYEKIQVSVGAWRRKHRKEYLAYMGRRYRANPDSYRNAAMLRNYGITLDDYKTMLKNQGGKCACCGADKSGFKLNTFAVDHCHQTGIVRGLLCSRCNLAIGQIGDRPQIARKIADYLDNHQPREN